MLLDSSKSAYYMTAACSCFKEICLLMENEHVNDAGAQSCGRVGKKYLQAPIHCFHGHTDTF